MKIIWDDNKRRANLDKHGIDFADLAVEFEMDTALVVPARDRRFKALGRFRGAIISVIFAVYGREAVSLISARLASRKERKRYDE